MDERTRGPAEKISPTFWSLMIVLYSILASIVIGYATIELLHAVAVAPAVHATPTDGDLVDRFHRARHDLDQLVSAQVAFDHRDSTLGVEDVKALLRSRRVAMRRADVRGPSWLVRDSLMFIPVSHGRPGIAAYDSAHGFLFALHMPPDGIRGGLARHIEGRWYIYREEIPIRRLDRPGDSSPGFD